MPYPKNPIGQQFDPANASVLDTLRQRLARRIYASIQGGARGELGVAAMGTTQPMGAPAAGARKVIKAFHGSAEIARRGGLKDGLRLDVSPSGAPRRVGETVDSMGTWWTTSPNDAKHFSRSIAPNGNTIDGAVIAGEVALDNPKVFGSGDEFQRFISKYKSKDANGFTRPANGEAVARELSSLGHDGIIIRGGGKSDMTPDGADFLLSFGNKGVSVER